MYHHLNGKLIEKKPTYAVVECCGIGFYALISLNTYSQLKDEGSQLTLLTHLIVREDAQLLYGFSTDAERELFRHLIQVSGVGPNTALLILSAMGAKELKSVIASGDFLSLKRIKGIGEKTAQRIVIDLQNKVEKVDTGIFSTPGNTIRNEALSALLLLGFQRMAAEKAIDKVISTSGSDNKVEDLIKQALKLL
jgi:Holliday junction DNA helicase RuvA